MSILFVAVQIKNELNDDMLRSEQIQWSFQEQFWVYTIRLFTTFINFLILIGSVIAVVLAATQGKVLARSENVRNQFLTFILEYLVSITMGGTSIIAPIFFKIMISFQRLRSETKTNQVNVFQYVLNFKFLNDFIWNFKILGWRVALRFLSLLAVFITYYLEIADCDLQNKVVDRLTNLDTDLNLTSLTSFR